MECLIICGRSDHPEPFRSKKTGAVCVPHFLRAPKYRLTTERFELIFDLSRYATQLGYLTTMSYRRLSRKPCISAALWYIMYTKSPKSLGTTILAASLCAIFQIWNLEYGSEVPEVQGWWSHCTFGSAVYLWAQLLKMRGHHLPLFTSHLRPMFRRRHCETLSKHRAK